MMDKIKKTSVPIKNFSFFLFFSLSMLCHISQANPEGKLQTADSLFHAKKYTESLEIYEEILEQNKSYSPAMLMKMAFIKEGLGDYSNALYYLNLYFKESLDKKALVKIEALADKQQLRGYDSTQVTYFNELFFKYFRYLIAVSLAILFLAILLAANHAAKGKSPVALIVLLIFLVPATIAFNYDWRGSDAIIVSDTTYLMDGPSGSANVVLTLSKGHKITVKRTEGVWASVVWNDETFYVRKNSLKQII